MGDRGMSLNRVGRRRPLARMNLSVRQNLIGEGGRQAARSEIETGGVL